MKVVLAPLEPLTSLSEALVHRGIDTVTECLKVACSPEKGPCQLGERDDIAATLSARIDLFAQLTLHDEHGLGAVINKDAIDAAIPWSTGYCSCGDVEIVH